MPRSICAFVLAGSLAPACGDAGASSEGSSAATGTAASTSSDATGGTSATAPTTTTGEATSGASGGAKLYGAYFRLQSFSSQIQLLGNFLESFQDGGGTTIGLCTKLGISTGFARAGGSVTVLRGEEVLLVADPTPSAMIASVTLAAGDALSFDAKAPDGLIPDFTVGPLVVPSTPTDFVWPTSIAVGDPVTISWTPPPDAIGDVLVELVQSQVGINKVECVVPIADGAVTIDAGLLTHLVPTDADNPMAQMTISPFDELVEVIQGSHIEFEFFAVLTGSAAPVVAG